MQGFDTAEQMVQALADGSLRVCNATAWTEPTYNNLVRQAHQQSDSHDVSCNHCRLCTALSAVCSDLHLIRHQQVKTPSIAIPFLALSC